MTTREWVEVAAKTIDEATREGLAALGLGSVDEAEIEVVQQPKPGFLGMGAQDAVVIVRPKPKEGKRRRSRGRRGRGKSDDRSGETKDSGAEKHPKKESAEKKSSSSSGRTSPDERRSEPRKPREQRSGAPTKGDKGRSSGGGAKKMDDQREDGPDRAEQAAIVEEFLVGLLGAFGLEGEVTTRIEDDVIYADVTGTQTEALVGTKGSIMSSVLELCRTVVQRKSQASARIRLDIAGYTARRREALQIYAQRLTAKVIEEGGEIMLEPMNAAERKVVHDAIVEIEGVRTFSEGQDPNRSVVIAKDGEE